MPGKMGGGEARELTLNSQGCSFEPFRAKEMGSISGVLRDAAGEPVRRAFVELLRASDRQRVRGVFPAHTESDGTYRLEEVPGGTYLVGFHVKSAPDGTRFSWAPYERSYYPGVRDVEKARPVTVNPAQAVAGVTWSIGPPLRPRTIHALVLGPDGKPAASVFVQLQAEGYDYDADLAQSDKNGAISLAGLIGIRYVIAGSVELRGKGEFWHCHSTPVSDSDQPVVVRFFAGEDCAVCRKLRRRAK